MMSSDYSQKGVNPCSIDVPISVNTRFLNPAVGVLLDSGACEVNLPPASS